MNLRAGIHSLIATVTLVATLFTNLKACAEKPVADTTLIMLINETPVYQAELNREMKACRSTVFREYATTYNLSNTKDFWNTNFNGKTPQEDMKQRAIKALIHLKIQEKLLRDKGLWPYKNYAALITDLSNQNSKRQKAETDKEITYGPTRFTEQTFFDYQFSNALVKLKNVMKGQEIPISETLLRTYFAELKKSLFNSTTYSFEDVKQQVEDHYMETQYKLLIESIYSSIKVNPLIKS